MAKIAKIAPSPKLAASYPAIKRFLTVLPILVGCALLLYREQVIYHLIGMLRASFAVCLLLATCRGERFGGPSLNGWDEAIAYIGVALLLAPWG
jgi:hypothetical protein